MIKTLTKKYLNELTYEVIGSAIEVQRVMGIGLLESVYHECMKEEINSRSIKFNTELKIPVMYKQKEILMDFRCDLFIDIFHSGQRTFVNNYFAGLAEN